jgi:hypothetical protein
MVAHANRGNHAFVWRLDVPIRHCCRTIYLYAVLIMVQMDNPNCQSKSKRRGGYKLRLRRKIAYTCVCILVALLLAEAGVRARAWYRYGSFAPNVPDELVRFDKELGLRIPRAGAERIGSKIHIRINSLGFRGDEFSVKKPRKTLRIVCVGASTTFCAEASDNGHTWPARLEAILQPKYPTVTIQVINAGVGGYVISDSLKNIENRVLPLEPDLVIYYEANNDIALDTRDLARQRGVIAESDNYRSPLSKFLSEHSLFYDLVTKNFAVLSSRRDTVSGKITELPHNSPDRFIGQLKLMHDMLFEKRIPLVLSCFLTKYRRDQPRETQIANAELAFYYMPWMTIDSLLDGIDLYDEAIVRFAHSNQIPVVEDRTSIPADDTHFADFVHLRDEGCEAMAERFAEFFAKNDVLGPIIVKAATTVPSVASEQRN